LRHGAIVRSVSAAAILCSQPGSKLATKQLCETLDAQWDYFSVTPLLSLEQWPSVFMRIGGAGLM
jgi:hypothetical protein